MGKRFKKQDMMFVWLSAKFQILVRQNGLNFYPISVDFRQFNRDAGRKLIGSGQNPIRG